MLCEMKQELLNKQEIISNQQQEAEQILSVKSELKAKVDQMLMEREKLVQSHDQFVQKFRNEYERQITSMQKRLEQSESQNAQLKL